MKRTKKDPTAWRSTPAGDTAWRACRAGAQALANELGFDYGIEANDLFHTFRHFMLPGKQFRFGPELRCEVVMCENLARCQPGHGPTAGQNAHAGAVRVSR